MAGERLLFELVSAVGDVGDRLVRVQVRDRVGGRLVADLGPFCSMSILDPKVVVVDVPGEVTSGWSVSGVWDGWFGSERVGFGPFQVELGVSQGGGRIMSISGWDPVLMLGDDFSREIMVGSLLPSNETLSPNPGVFRVSAVNGGDSVFPAAVDTLSGSARIDLGVSDVQSLGLGRFVYSLLVLNGLGEERTVLAGVLRVVEGGG